jgi:hypothetical protein
MEERDQVGEKLRVMLTMRHYYGDIVRALFVVAAVIIFLGVPLTGALPTPILVVLIPITLIVIFFAGFTNPRLYTVAIVDALISGLGCLFFETLAVAMYSANGVLLNPALYVLQILSIIFLISFYFSIKTVRGMSVLDDSPRPSPHPENPSGRDTTSYF